MSENTGPPLRAPTTNLVLVCTCHHKLLHEGGWSVCLEDAVAEWYGSAEVGIWIEPNGRRYDPRPTRWANTSRGLMG